MVCSSARDIVFAQRLPTATRPLAKSLPAMVPYKQGHETEGEAAMKRKVKSVVLVSAAVLSVIAAGVLAALCEIEYDCVVDFDFVDSTAVTRLPSECPTGPDAALGYCRTKEAAEQARQAIADNRAEDFRRWLSWSRSRREWMKCIQNSSRVDCPRDSGTNRLATVLSGAAFEIVGMPTTNFVYGCRIRFAPSTDGRIPEIAQFIMDVLSDFVADLNEVNVYKASIMEQQEKFRRERKIAELEKLAAASPAEIDVATALAHERASVDELNLKIAAIRQRVLETDEKRITHVVIHTTASVRFRYGHARTGFFSE